MIREYHLIPLSSTEKLIYDYDINILDLRNTKITTLSDSLSYSSIRSIILPDTLKSIDNAALSHCDKLLSIIVPDSVTSIGKFAFYECNSLTSITIPFVGQLLDGTGNTVFGWIFGTDQSYWNVEYVPKSLKEVVITGGVTIDDLAFENCKSITTIVIPTTINKIGEYAFYNCISLANINYLGTVEQWNQISLGTDWNSGIPATYIQCSNGQVTL